MRNVGYSSSFQEVLHEKFNIIFLGTTEQIENYRSPI